MPTFDTNQIAPAIDDIANRVALAVTPGAPAITNRDRVREAVRHELRNILLNFNPTSKPADHADHHPADSGDHTCCR